MKTAVHDICFHNSPGIFSSSALQGATCLQNYDTEKIGRKAFQDLEENIGKHFEQKPITKPV